MVKKKFLRKMIPLNEDQTDYLIHGFCLDWVEPNQRGWRDMGFPFRDMDEARELWEKNRSYIMSFEGTFPEGTRPGVKPWAYREFEEKKTA